MSRHELLGLLPVDSNKELAANDIVDIGVKVTISDAFCLNLDFCIFLHCIASLSRPHSGPGRHTKITVLFHGCVTLLMQVNALVTTTA